MRFIASVLSVSLLLLLGRLAGFVREWLIARYGGASASTDIAIVLVTLPDLMVTLLIGGGFSAAIVPLLKGLAPAEASRMFVQLSLICGAAFLAVAAVIIAYSQELMHVLSPGVPEMALAQAAPLFMLAALAVPLAALSGVNQARLVSHEQFWLSQSGTVVFNIAIILAILLFGGTDFLTSIALGILAGAAGRVALQYMGIWRSWTPLAKEWMPLDPGLFKDIFRATVFSATIALLPVMGRAFASEEGSGGLSLFSYAFRLTELPIALVFAALATVFLPRIAAAYRADEQERGAREIALILRFATLSSIAIIIPVTFFADEFLFLIFSTTPVTPEQFGVLNTALIMGFAFMPFRGLLVLALPILAAVGKARLLPFPAIVAIVSTLLISPITTDISGVTGAMLGYGLGHLVSCVVFLVLLVPIIGSDLMVRTVEKFGSCYLLPAAACILVCWLGQRWSDGIWIALASSAVAIAVFGALLVVNDGDARRLLHRVGKRVSGRHHERRAR